MNTTPESFKIDPGFETVTVDFYSFRPEPGLSRVLARARFGNNQYVELTCLEWSPSKIRVKVDFTMDGRTQHGIWIDPGNSLELIERLPDVESGNHKTGQASGVEATGGEWLCTCDHCTKIKAWVKKEGAHLDRIIEKYKDEIEPGRTFSVIPPEA